MLAPKYIALATAPIGEDDFAGPDVRYSVEYEELESELEKANSLHQKGGPDWQKVVTLAEHLLGNQSKDLRVGCWLAWGLFRSEGAAGLQAGLAMLVQLCDMHWDNLHPRKDRTRSASVAWLTGRIESALVDSPTLGGTTQTLEKLAEDLARLDISLQRHLGDQAPLLLPLAKRLRSQASQADSPSPPPIDPQPLSLVSNNSNPTTSAAAAEEVGSPREAHRALRALQEQARPLCAWWQNQSIQDPRAVALSRVLLWLPIEALPERDSQGKTGLRGLPADRLAAFRDRLGKGQPAELLRDVEISISRAPFWLDGQYLAWQCLDALGAEAAMRTLEQHLAGLLQRLPGLEKLSFFDGTPFATPETLSWIGSRITTSRSRPSQDLSCSAGSSETAWDLAFQEASVLLTKEGLAAALSRLGEGSRQSRGGRDRLKWQIATARLCRQAGKHDLARNLLEAAEQQLCASGMAEWEPDLLVQVMRLLLDCYEHLPVNATMRQRRDEIFQRLCHLDFEVVLETALGPKQ